MNTTTLEELNILANSLFNGLVEVDILAVMKSSILSGLLCCQDLFSIDSIYGN